MLKIIDKYFNEDNKFKINVRYELSDYEKRLFIHSYIDKKPLNRGDSTHLSRISGKIYEEEKWIQCDCLDLYEKPLLRLKRSKSGNLFLARITRTSHDYNCPFKEITRQISSSQKTSVPVYKIKEGPLNLISKKASGISVSATKNSLKETTAGTKRRSTLCKCLYTIIDKAELNCISLDTSSTPYQRLLQTVSSIEIVSNLTLKDYFHTNPTKKGFYDAAIALKNDKRKWPKTYSKHGVFLVKAKSFNKNGIEAYINAEKTQFIEITNQIIPSSGRLGERSGPYMAFIIVKDSVLKPDFYEPKDAFIVPCYSQSTFIPLDSYYERLVLKNLFALQFSMKKRGISFEIIKPLFDIEAEDETGVYHVLPDFLIKTPTKTIVIEVAGSHEADYLERKQRMHQHMQILGPLLNIDCYGAELNNRLEFELNQLTQKITNLLY